MSRASIIGLLFFQWNRSHFQQTITSKSNTDKQSFDSCSSSSKKFIFKKDNSKLPSYMKTATLCSWMETTNKGLKCLVVGKWVQDPLLKRTSADSSTKPLQQSTNQRILIDMELKEMLRNGSVTQVFLSVGEFLSRIFLVGKKDGGTDR